MKLEALVSKNPKVHSGDLVFTGTRIPAKLVIDAIEADAPLSEFLEGYPDTTRKRAIALLREGLRRIEAEVDLRNKPAGASNMRVLLDHDVPMRLRHDFPTPLAETTRHRGWQPHSIRFASVQVASVLRVRDDRGLCITQRT